MQTSLFKCVQPGINWSDDALADAWVLKIANHSLLQFSNPPQLAQHLGQKITSQQAGIYELATERHHDDLEFYLYVSQKEAQEKARQIEAITKEIPELQVLVSKSTLIPGFFIQWPPHITAKPKNTLSEIIDEHGLVYSIEHNDTGVLGFGGIKSVRKAEPRIKI